jgi:hypothetical protein
MIKRAVRDLWNDITTKTADEVEIEIIHAIITEFIPRFNPKEGKFRPFIKMQIISRIQKDWNRLTYVNSEKDKSKPRSMMDREYIQLIHTRDENLDPEVRRAVIIQIGIDVLRKNHPLDLTFRKDYFQYCLIGTTPGVFKIQETDRGTRALLRSLSKKRDRDWYN